MGVYEGAWSWHSVGASDTDLGSIEDLRYSVCEDVRACAEVVAYLASEY